MNENEEVLPEINADVFNRVSEDATVENENVPASAEAQEAVKKALQAIKDRSFSGRNPQLGKMVKCQVCGTRHRSVIKCEQRFKELHTEEDLETGEITKVFATCIQPDKKPTARQKVGAQGFKGKRKNPHPNQGDLQLIQRSKKIFGETGNEGYVSQEKFQETIRLTRTTAERQLRKENRRKAKKFRRVQDASRRINRGLA
jgi:hypothetical protein